jgi:hypothetical protein
MDGGAFKSTEQHKAQEMKCGRTDLETGRLTAEFEDDAALTIITSDLASWQTFEILSTSWTSQRIHSTP